MEITNLWDARFLFELLKNGFLLAGGVYVWWTTRNRATSTAIRDVHVRLDEVDKHVSRLEQTLENRPGFSEIDKLRGEMAGMNRSVGELAMQVQASNALLNRLHEYLLTEKGNR
tara:strand:+ start:2467 stop:2808 length:342 start_codon:yes stop_codon:yes gene_type:complete